MQRLLASSALLRLCRVQRQPLQSAAGAASLHTGTATLMPEVLVPALGESVSEGTISAVLKKTGDSVAVDETVAQLETDKVTIDCKSPHAGTVTAFQVKVGDVVKPGTLVCSVGAVGATAATPAAPAPSATTSASSPAVTTSTKPSTASSAAHRTPMIHFPPRILPDGRRISALPAAEADAALAAATGAASATPPTAAAATPPPPPTAPSAQVATSAAPGTAAPKPPPRKALELSLWVPKFDGQLRRQLTESEIDVINSGGAF